MSKHGINLDVLIIVGMGCWSSSANAWGCPYLEKGARCAPYNFWLVKR
jgi:hypothetical protein